VPKLVDAFTVKVSHRDARTGAAAATGSSLRDGGRRELIGLSVAGSNWQRVDTSTRDLVYVRHEGGIGELGGGTSCETTQLSISLVILRRGVLIRGKKDDSWTPTPTPCRSVPSHSIGRNE